MNTGTRFRAALRAAIGGTLVSILASSCYYVKQGTRLLSYQASAKRVEAVLADPAVPEDTRAFLELTTRIRAFAVDELGLKPTRNYSSYADIGRDTLAYVVSACAPLSFDRHYWNYPFMGKLPYKGFFDEPDARAEAERLKKTGLDVITRRVDAFSTLGFLADPLYSFMGKYDEYRIANLLIHELAHATLFVKNQPQFNEEFATFVGDAGALLWMQREHGADGPELRAVRDADADSAAFTAYLRGLAAELETVYRSARTDAEKKTEKSRIFTAAKPAYDDGYAARFRTDAYRSFDPSKLNNAYLDLYRLYEGEPALYAAYYDRACAKDLRAFVSTIVALSKQKGDLKALIVSATPAE